MDRYHARRALRAAKISWLEEVSLLTGILLVVAGCLAALITLDLGGAARLLGAAGLVAVMACAASRGFRLYRAGTAAALPTSVSLVRVRARPNRVVSVPTVGLSLGLPTVACLSVVVVVDWGWLMIAALALLGAVAVFTLFTERLREGGFGSKPPAMAVEILERLCMRADVEVPRLVVERVPVATAWTARGRIHVTKQLLELLDDAELEAVLAHELAHLARRDAALTEVCSAPSHLLLTLSASLGRRAARWVGTVSELPGCEVLVAMAVAVLALFIPPTFVFGWLSRLPVLGMSRSREFTADAAAVTLTGRPSALASALLKLEHGRDWTLRADLRQVEANAVLCIVGRPRSGPGRLLATHPPVASRVKRLERVEGRIQAESSPGRLWDPKW